MYIYANFLEDGILHRLFSLVMHLGRFFFPRILKKSFLAHYMVIKMCYWNTIRGVGGGGRADFYWLFIENVSCD